MSPEFIARKFESDDKNEVIDLLELVFNGWPHFQVNPHDYFDWKYMKNPLGFSILTVVEHRENIIAFSGAIPQIVKIGSQEYLCSTGVDLSVHPDFRGQRISSLMRPVKDKARNKANIKLNYSVSTNPIVLARRKRETRYYFPYKPYVFCKIKDIKLHQNYKKTVQLYKQMGFRVIKTIMKLTRSTKKSREYEKYVVKEIKKFDKQADILWRSVSPNYNFILKRNQNYLNWRYLHPQNPMYKVISAEKDGQLVGYCVFCVNKNIKEYPIGYIVDLYKHPNHPFIYDMLIQEADKYFEENQINCIYWQITGKNPQIITATNHGYLNSRYVNEFSINPAKVRIKEDIQLFLKSNPEKLHFVYGDFDWI